jgi:hypothetical protein
MKPIKLLIAAIVLAGLAGVIWWANKHPEQPTTPAITSVKLFAVPDAQLQSVEVQRKDAPLLSVTKESSKWEIISPQKYPADQDAVQSMVSSLSDISADSVVESSAGNLAEFGLADPAVSVTAHEKNGKTIQIAFGMDVPASAEVYAKVGTTPKVYEVSSSLKSSFSKDVNDLRDKRMLAFDSAQISLLQLIQPKGQIDFGKLNATDWQMVKPGPYRADNFQVDDLVHKLSDAKMDLSVKPEDAKAAETAFKTGKPVATVKVTDPNGVHSLEVRQNKDDYYAQSNTGLGDYKIASDLGQLLAKSVDDFRTKKLFDFGFSDTRKLDLHSPSGDKTYVRAGADWKYNGKNMDAGSVQALVVKLRDLTATAFVTTGFGNPSIGITVVSNDGKRTEHIDIAKVTDGYIAKREGQPTLYKLDSKAVNDILEAASGIKPMASGTKK